MKENIDLVHTGHWLDHRVLIVSPHSSKIMFGFILPIDMHLCNLNLLACMLCFTFQTSCHF